MATGNIDCNISDGMYFNNHLNVNIFNNPDVSNSNNIQFPLSMQQSSIANVRDAMFDEEPVINDLAIELQSELMIDNNENCCEPLSSLLSTSDIKYDNLHNFEEENENLLAHSSPPKVKSPPLSNIKEIIPEELFINVESEDEGVHSWRPNMSSSSLCHDFFMPPENSQNKTDLNLCVFSVNESNDISNFTDKTVNFQNPISKHNDLVPESYIHPSQASSSNFKIDIQSHMRSQIAGLNIIRYEVINARRKATDLKEGIQRLKHKLNERLIVQRALDVGKLKDENDKLSLECQCLCMEVDYYLKGKAPLGEVDESFYRQKPQSNRNTVNPEVQAAAQQQSDDLDQDSKKWECHECTFINHPLIKTCEMCHTPRLSKDSHLYTSTNLESCYCHPKKHSS